MICSCLEEWRAQFLLLHENFCESKKFSAVIHGSPPPQKKEEYDESYHEKGATVTFPDGMSRTWTMEMNKTQFTNYEWWLDLIDRLQNLRKIHNLGWSSSRTKTTTEFIFLESHVLSWALDASLGMLRRHLRTLSLRQVISQRLVEPQNRSM